MNIYSQHRYSLLEIGQLFILNDGSTHWPTTPAHNDGRKPAMHTRVIMLINWTDLPACGSPAIFSVHLASSAVTTAGSIPKSMGDNVVRIWMQLKRWCVSCVWVLQRGHSGDICDLVSTLCAYDLRKGDVFILSWAMVRRVRHGRAANVWWRCAQYFVIAPCG